MNESPAVSPMKASSTYGLFLGLALAVLQIIQYLSGLYISTLFSVITFIVFIVGIVLAIKLYRDKQNNGFLSYGQGVMTGSFTGLFAGLLLAVVMLMIVMVIDKEYPEKFLMQMEETYLNAGLDEEMVDQMMEKMKEDVSAISFVYGPVFQFGIGALVISLIASIFLKKTSLNSFDNDTL